MGQSTSQQVGSQNPSLESNQQACHHNGKSMTNLQKLEDLYNREIKVDEAEEKKYRGIVKHLVDNVVIEKLKQTSPDMANLYRETYWGGILLRRFEGWLHP